MAGFLPEWLLVLLSKSHSRVMGVSMWLGLCSPLSPEPPASSCLGATPHCSLTPCWSLWDWEAQCSWGEVSFMGYCPHCGHNALMPSGSLGKFLPPHGQCGVSIGLWLTQTTPAWPVSDLLCQWAFFRLPNFLTAHITLPGPWWSRCEEGAWNGPFGGFCQCLSPHTCSQGGCEAIQGIANPHHVSQVLPVNGQPPPKCSILLKGLSLESSKFAWPDPMSLSLATEGRRPETAEGLSVGPLKETLQ